MHRRHERGNGGRWRWACALLAGGALALALAGCGSSAAADHSTTLRGVAKLPPGIAGHPAPHIHLRAARGGSFDTRSLAGHAYAVTFLYTHCPDVCPLIATEVSEALERMGAAARRVSVLGVSVDPSGDTAENARVFLRQHQAPANFRYLLGTTAQLAPVWKAYFAAPQVAGDPESAHTAAIWLIDRRGRLRAKFDAGVAFDPAALAHDLEVLAGARPA